MSSSLHALRALLAAGLLLSPREAACAACVPWNAGFNAVFTMGAESRTTHMYWGQGPEACTNSSGDDWDGVHHFEIHVAETNTIPDTPDGSYWLASVSSASYQWEHEHHRANKTFYYRVYACENDSCSDFYGNDGADESVSGDKDDHTTGVELWLVTGVTGESDTSSYVKDNGANAPEGFFYPTGWGSWGDTLVMYYSISGDTSNPSEVRHVRYTSSGWPTSPNNPSDWVGDTLVLEGDTDTAEDDFGLDHPWSMLIDDGSDQWVELMMQNHACSYAGNCKVVQIASDDDEGTDFGLGCSGSSCTDTPLDSGMDGYVAVEHSSTPSHSMYNVSHAQHGRFWWDYLNDGPVDPGADAPSILFNYGYGPYCSYSYNDNLASAVGSYSSSIWTWTVDVDGSNCPVNVADNVHDNTIVPLGDGAFKVYYKQHSDDHWRVTYHDGSAWESHDAPVAFIFDDGLKTPLSDECVENLMIFRYDDGGTIRQGALFMLWDSDECAAQVGGSPVGRDDDVGDVRDDSAILFAELSN
ncbi:MAG: hypothetical protein H6739_28405 [Alphaproteobacteria bacterium]|nr:hypothetical protein [Alphaproteobacteria bacterium]